MQETVTVKLIQQQWALVLAALDRWSAVAERLGHDEEVDEARTVRKLVAARLGRHAW